METKPLLNYKTPNYPRIEVVFSEPEMLLKNMPQTWQSNKFIVTAMISFSLSACKTQINNIENKVKVEHIVQDTLSKEEAKFVKQDSIKIAPIFVHGEGVGASGCVMIAPPVYLSEAEAMKIILTELKREGLQFSDTYEGNSIPIERKKFYYNDDENITNWEDRYKDSIEIKNLYPDAYSKDLNMIIEFVSLNDFETFGDEDMEWSSVSEYYIKLAAEKIQKKLKENEACNSVVFYDPVGWAGRENRGSWEKMEKIGREKAVEMLKLQVTDFIEWLKKENLIQNK